MKRAYLLAGAADRATMVDGCPLGPVATKVQQLALSYGTGPLTHDYDVIGADVQQTGVVVPNPLDDRHEQRLYAQSCGVDRSVLRDAINTRYTNTLRSLKD